MLQNSLLLFPLVICLLLPQCLEADRNVDGRGHHHQHKHHQHAFPTDAGSGGHQEADAGSQEPEKIAKSSSSSSSSSGTLEESEEAKAIKESLVGLGTLLQEAETAAKSAEEAAASWKETGSGKSLMEYEPKLHNAAKQVAQTLKAAHAYVQQQVKGLPDESVDDLIKSVPHRSEAPERDGELPDASQDVATESANPTSSQDVDPRAKNVGSKDVGETEEDSTDPEKDVVDTASGHSREDVDTESTDPTSGKGVEPPAKNVGQLSTAEETTEQDSTATGDTLEDEESTLAGSQKPVHSTFIERSMAIGPRTSRHFSHAADREERVAQLRSHMHLSVSDADEASWGGLRRLDNARGRSAEDTHQEQRPQHAAYMSANGQDDREPSWHARQRRQEADNFNTHQESPSFFESENGARRWKSESQFDDNGRADAHRRHSNLGFTSNRNHQEKFADDASLVNLDAFGHAIRHRSDRASHQRGDEDVPTRWDSENSFDESGGQFHQSAHRNSDEYDRERSRLQSLERRRGGREVQADDEYGYANAAHQMRADRGEFSRDRVPDRENEVYHLGQRDAIGRQFSHGSFSGSAHSGVFVRDRPDSFLDQDHADIPSSQGEYE